MTTRKTLPVCFEKIPLKKSCFWLCKRNKIVVYISICLWTPFFSKMWVICITMWKSGKKCGKVGSPWELTLDRITTTYSKNFCNTTKIKKSNYPRRPIKGAGSVGHPSYRCISLCTFYPDYCAHLRPVIRPGSSEAQRFMLRRA